MGFRDFGLMLDQAQAVDADSFCDIQLADGFSIQAEWTGTVLGVVTVYSRNDETLSWQPVADINSLLTQPTGSAGGYVFEVGNARSKFYRIGWDYQSGTGSFKLAVHAKGGGL